MLWYQDAETSASFPTRNTFPWKNNHKTDCLMNSRHTRWGRHNYVEEDPLEHNGAYSHVNVIYTFSWYTWYSELYLSTSHTPLINLHLNQPKAKGLLVTHQAIPLPHWASLFSSESRKERREGQKSLNPELKSPPLFFLSCRAGPRNLRHLGEKGGWFAVESWKDGPLQKGLVAWKWCLHSCYLYINKSAIWDVRKRRSKTAEREAKLAKSQYRGVKTRKQRQLERLASCPDRHPAPERSPAHA